MQDLDTIDKDWEIVDYLDMDWISEIIQTIHCNWRILITFGDNMYGLIMNGAHMNGLSIYLQIEH